MVEPMDDDGIDVEDRMRRFVKCDGSPQSISNVLCDGLTDREQEVLALGIRVGKHSAAITVIRELRSEVGDLVAQKIDPYLEITDATQIKACRNQVADNGIFKCRYGGICNPDKCPKFKARSTTVKWPKTL